MRIPEEIDELHFHSNTSGLILWSVCWLAVGILIGVLVCFHG